MSNRVSSAEILPSLIKGRHNNTNNNNTNNKAKCIPGGTLRVLAGKKHRRNGTNVKLIWRKFQESMCHFYG
jgi:hypothetical protein